jgi:hypothetical protein
MSNASLFTWLFAILPLSVVAQGQGYLENPQPDSSQSGISVVSGWHCDASVIEFQIDDRRLVTVPYGSERQDTEPVCGDWNNGFSFLLNYSGMGDGPHTITVYADGVPFGFATFTVTTYGEQFVQGLQKTVTVADFPSPGSTSVLRWDEAKQNFALQSVSWGSPGNGHGDARYATVEGVELVYRLTSSDRFDGACALELTGTNYSANNRTCSVSVSWYDFDGRWRGGATAGVNLPPGITDSHTMEFTDLPSCDEIGRWDLTQMPGNSPNPSCWQGVF